MMVAIGGDGVNGDEDDNDNAWKEEEPSFLPYNLFCIQGNKLYRKH